MKQTKFKKHQQKWQRMAKLWAEFTKPGRPSKEDIKNYAILLHSVIKDINSPQIILFGSTPELRNLFYKFSKNQDAQIICIDMTDAMYKAMSGFVRYKNKNEKFVKSNWLKLSSKIKPKSIDVVIGDYLLGNVGGFEDKFLKEIKKILKNNGNFITRTQIMDGIKKEINFYKDFKKVCSQVKQKKISIKEASSYFANIIILQGWHLNKENKTSLSFFSNKEFSDLDNKIKTHRDVIELKVLNQFYKSWWQMKDKYWTNYKQSELEKKIKKHFEIKKVLYSKDYNIVKQSPIYLLKKK